MKYPSKEKVGNKWKVKCSIDSNVYIFHEEFMADRFIEDMKENKKYMIPFKLPRILTKYAKNKGDLK